MDLEGVSVAECLATHLASNGHLGSVELLNVQPEVSLATAGRGAKLALKRQICSTKRSSFRIAYSYEICMYLNCTFIFWKKKSWVPDFSF